MMPHPSWWVPQKNRTVDKTGVAVALAFLVAIGLVAAWRGDQAGEKSLVRSDVPVQVETRQAARASLEDERPTTDPLMPGMRADLEAPHRASMRQRVEEGPAR